MINPELLAAGSVVAPRIELGVGQNVTFGCVQSSTADLWGQRGAVIPRRLTCILGKEQLLFQIDDRQSNQTMCLEAQALAEMLYTTDKLTVAAPGAKPVAPIPVITRLRRLIGTHRITSFGTPSMSFRSSRARNQYNVESSRTGRSRKADRNYTCSFSGAAALRKVQSHNTSSRARPLIKVA